MKKLAMIGLAAAMALSTSVAVAQGGGAGGAAGGAGTRIGTGTGAGTSSTIGMGTGELTHPPGSTVDIRHSNSPLNNDSTATGAGTSNLPANNSRRPTNPR